MELWDIYDSTGCKTGSVKKRGDVLETGEFHLATEVWIINDKLDILIQKRSSDRKVLPNMWGLTTGCMISGEDTIDGSIREVSEELGINIKKDELNFVRRIFRTNTIWDIYFVHKNIDLSYITLQQEEVSDAKLVSIQEFRDMISSNQIFEYPEIHDILALIK